MHQINIDCCVRSSIDFCSGCTPIKLGAVPAHFDKLFNERYDELLLESTPTKTTGGDVGDSGSKIRDALSRKRKAKELESIATPKKASSGTNSLANTAPPAMASQELRSPYKHALS